MRPFPRLLTPLILCLAAGWSVPAAAHLTCLDCELIAVAQPENTDDTVGAIFLVDTLPFRDAHTASYGSISAAAEYDLTSSGIEVLMEHALDPTQSAAICLGELHFTVDTPVTYQLEGAYHASNAVGTSVIQEVTLRNWTLRNTTLEQEWLFVGEQDSDSTADISFELGGMPGDDNDILFGSTTGTLLPGYEYELEWNYILFEGGDTGATADGFFRMTLIPEPSTALLLGSGLVALAARRRRSVRYQHRRLVIADAANSQTGRNSETI